MFSSWVQRWWWKKNLFHLQLAKRRPRWCVIACFLKKKFPIQHSLSELTSSKLKALKSKLDCVPAYPCVMSLIWPQLAKMTLTPCVQLHIPLFFLLMRWSPSPLYHLEITGWIPWGIWHIMSAYYIFIHEKVFHSRKDPNFQWIIIQIAIVYNPWYFISFEDKFELIDSSDMHVDVSCT